MNKLLIVLLAVCLFSVVSAHTFVKRDAPATPTPLDNMKAHYNAVKDRITELGTDISKQLAESVKPEVIKKNVNDLIDSAAKTFENFRPMATAVEDKAAAPAAQ